MREGLMETLRRGLIETIHRYRLAEYEPSVPHSWFWDNHSDFYVPRALTAYRAANRNNVALDPSAIQEPLNQPQGCTQGDHEAATNFELQFW